MLAYAEDGTDETENDTPCETNVTSSYSMQDCQGSERYYRATLNFKCTGNNVGLCIEGVQYIYYDCDGKQIKDDRRTQGKSCK